MFNKNNNKNSNQDLGDIIDRRNFLNKEEKEPENITPTTIINVTEVQNDNDTSDGKPIVIPSNQTPVFSTAEPEKPKAPAKQEKKREKFSFFKRNKKDKDVSKSTDMDPMELARFMNNESETSEVDEHTSNEVVTEEATNDEEVVRPLHLDLDTDTVEDIEVSANGIDVDEVNSTSNDSIQPDVLDIEIDIPSSGNQQPEVLDIDVELLTSNNGEVIDIDLEEVKPNQNVLDINDEIFMPKVTTEEKQNVTSVIDIDLEGFETESVSRSNTSNSLVLDLEDYDLPKAGGEVIDLGINFEENGFSDKSNSTTAEEIDLRETTVDRPIIEHVLHIDSVHITIQKDISTQDEKPFVIDLVGDVSNINLGSNLQEVERQTLEAERIAEEERKAELQRIEVERIAEEERQAELRHIEAEQERQAELRRIEAERVAEEERQAELRRIEAERVAEEERQAELRRIEAERVAEEERQAELRRIEAERVVEEERQAELRLIEAERVAEEERQAELLNEQNNVSKIEAVPLFTESLDNTNTETNSLNFLRNREEAMRKAKLLEKQRIEEIRKASKDSVPSMPVLDNSMATVVSHMTPLINVMDLPETHTSVFSIDNEEVPSITISTTEEVGNINNRFFKLKETYDTLTVSLDSNYSVKSLKIIQDDLMKLLIPIKDVLLTLLQLERKYNVASGKFPQSKKGIENHDYKVWSAIRDYHNKIKGWKNQNNLSSSIIPGVFYINSVLEDIYLPANIDKPKEIGLLRINSDTKYSVGEIADEFVIKLDTKFKFNNNEMFEQFVKKHNNGIDCGFDYTHTNISLLKELLQHMNIGIFQKYLQHEEWKSYAKNEILFVYDELESNNTVRIISDFKLNKELGINTIQREFDNILSIIRKTKSVNNQKYIGLNNKYKKLAKNKQSIADMRSDILLYIKLNKITYPTLDYPSVIGNMPVNNLLLMHQELTENYKSKIANVFPLKFEGIIYRDLKSMFDKQLVFIADRNQFKEEYNLQETASLYMDLKRVVEHGHKK